MLDTMRTKTILMAATILCGFALPAQALNLIDNDFSSNPFGSPNLQSGFLAGTSDWYGAQHGVTGGVNGSGTMAWRNSAGAGGANGFVGYSPTTRYFVTLLARIPGGPANFGSLVDLDIETRNATAWPAGLVRAALHTGGTGGQWYVSDTGFSGNGATWTSLSFDLQSLMYRPYGNNQNMPNPGLGGEFKGAAQTLAANLAIDWVGIFVDFSGQNDPNRGDVLRFDNFRLTAVDVPEPASMALLGAGLLGLAGLRLRRNAARQG